MCVCALCVISGQSVVAKAKERRRRKRPQEEILKFLTVRAAKSVPLWLLCRIWKKNPTREQKVIEPLLCGQLDI